MKSYLLTTLCNIMLECRQHQQSNLHICCTSYSLLAGWFSLKAYDQCSNYGVGGCLAPLKEMAARLIARFWSVQGTREKAPSKVTLCAAQLTNIFRAPNFPSKGINTELASSPSVDTRASYSPFGRHCATSQCSTVVRSTVVRAV